MKQFTGLLCLALCLCLLPVFALGESAGMTAYEIGGFTYRVWNDWTAGEIQTDATSELRYYYRDPDNSSNGALMIGQISRSDPDVADLLTGDDTASLELIAQTIAGAMLGMELSVESVTLDGRAAVRFGGDMYGIFFAAGTLFFADDSLFLAILLEGFTTVEALSAALTEVVGEIGAPAAQTGTDGTKTADPEPAVKTDSEPAAETEPVVETDPEPAAEPKSDLPQILFRGNAWGASVDDFIAGDTTGLRWYESGDGDPANLHSLIDPLAHMPLTHKGLSVKLYTYTDIAVAGYTSDCTELYFARTPADGGLTQRSADTALYAAQYRFDLDADSASVAQDLTGKLARLYGEPAEVIGPSGSYATVTYTIWRGADNALLCLKTYDSSNYHQIYLTYATADGDNWLKLADDTLTQAAQDDLSGL